MQRVKVIRKDGKDITNSIKSIRCWIVTINSILQLWNHLQQSSVPIQYLLTRRLNQDSLENFFRAIRKQSGNAFNPTPIQFYHSFKKLFSIDYIKVDSGNCTADEESILIRCQDVKETQNVIFQTSSKATAFIINSDMDKYDYRNLPVTEENVFIYICGYLLRRLFTKHFCDTCALLAERDCNLDEAIHLFIHLF